MKELKNKLSGMRQEIIDGIDQDQKQSVSSFSNEVGDEVDHASEEMQREFYQLLSNRQSGKLKQIDEALARIDSGEYGVCEECDEEIPRKRLLALPFTKLCTDCQAQLEISSVSRSPGSTLYDFRLTEDSE